jgi:DNA (cytosine-5)-methyltransferase 1
MRFVDLFAGLGGFHHALSSLNHECVFASEIDQELRDYYRLNFPKAAAHVHGDIRVAKKYIPPHDILCAGFPCQPFSKSGSQLGFEDETRGTLFHEILEILEKHGPEYVILENVGNFERHDKGRTWKIVYEHLKKLDYTVCGTVHRASGGHGLISPHHFGHPHHRDRFFIVARKGFLPRDPFPRGDKRAATSLEAIVQSSAELTEADRAETALTPKQIACIDHWNKLLARLPEDVALPSVPIWGDEIAAKYEYEATTPYHQAYATVIAEMEESHPAFWEGVQEHLSELPNYARRETFPKWKQHFIRANRRWFESIKDHFPAGWVQELQQFPPSLRKLEWNCQGEVRDLWQHVLQFRPSGLRVKRYSNIPALVAMTTTQIPLLGPERRFLTRVEGLRLQGLPDRHLLPRSRERAFAALGNGVHVEVVKQIAERLLSFSSQAEDGAGDVIEQGEFAGMLA